QLVLRPRDRRSRRRSRSHRARPAGRRRSRLMSGVAHGSPGVTSAAHAVVAPPGAGGWLRRLGPLFRRHRRGLAISFGAALAGQGATVAGPLVLRHLIDRIAAGRRVTVAGTGLLVGLGIFRALAAHLQRMHSGRVSYEVEYDLRNAVVEHLSRLDFAAHDALSTGQIMSRASSDVRMIQLLVGFLPLVTGNA